MADEADDWIFDSIALYRNLFMYDLQHGITAMDWTNNQNVCIATSSGSKHELAELHLPDKLLKTNQEEAGLIKNRDFHMNAGCYCPHRVACLRHVPKSRMIVTSSDTDTSKIQFWKLGSDDTDVIKNITTVENINSKGPAHITPVPGTSHMVFGSHLDNLCTVDSITGQITSKGLERSEKISSMGFTDKHTLICCCQHTGDLVTFDLREDSKKVKFGHTSNVSVDQKCFWTCTVTESGVYKLSSTGEIRKTEKFDWSHDVGCWFTELKTLSGINYLTINVLPRDEDIIYISGFDSNVYIYKLPIMCSAESHKESEMSKYFFKHEGHWQNTTIDNKNDQLTTVTHILHPWQQDVALSAATDGSLHAWQFNEVYDK
ncbi:WD repeat-containing protein 73-like isoform X2 [Ylistrum balloti]|uniref:WD repeat-containing protein 73-like isoform X2 n=1 Tax=Ylistrum balloti TaxID=509963 RepID=UPI002905C752|nr:WD repeat-containing protein 73-like isoform X2 [Ylistrum balloti]